MFDRDGAEITGDADKDVALKTDLKKMSPRRFKLSYVLRKSQSRRRIIRAIFVFSLLIFVAVDFNLVRIPSEAEILQAHNNHRYSHLSAIPHVDDPLDHIIDKYDADDDSVLPVGHDSMDMTADAGDTVTGQTVGGHKLRAPTEEIEVSKQLVDALVELIIHWRLRSIAICPCDGRQGLITHVMERAKWSRWVPSLTCIESSENKMNNMRARLAHSVNASFVQNEFFKKENGFPTVDMYIVWPGLDEVSASDALVFYDKVRHSKSSFVAVGVFRHIAIGDERYADWLEEIKQRNMDIRREHDLTKPPFMFGHPKTRYIGVSRDIYRELFVYDTSSLLNEFA